MPARRSRATRTERIVTAGIWLLTFTLVGVGVGLFFSSTILLYVMIAIGVLVAWLIDRSVVNSYVERED